MRVSKSYVDCIPRPLYRARKPLSRPGMSIASASARARAPAAAREGPGAQHRDRRGQGEEGEELDPCHAKGRQGRAEKEVGRCRAESARAYTSRIRPPSRERPY